MTDQLPAEIAEAIENYGTTCEDMAASYDCKGFPAPEREEFAKEARAALDAVILKHLGVWRPIQSAPKDGTVFLAHYKSKFGPQVGAMHWTAEDLDHRKRRFHSWTMLTETAKATHWRPLPAPPTTHLGRSGLAEEGGG